MTHPTTQRGLRLTLAAAAITVTALITAAPSQATHTGYDIRHYFAADHPGTVGDDIAGYYDEDLSDVNPAHATIVHVHAHSVNGNHTYLVQGVYQRRAWEGQPWENYGPACTLSYLGSGTCSYWYGYYSAVNSRVVLKFGVDDNSDGSPDAPGWYSTQYGGF